MKFLIPQDKGVWVRDIVVSELWVVALGLYGPKISQDYPLIPTCSTLHFSIIAASCNIRPGWSGNPSRKLSVTALGLDRQVTVSKMVLILNYCVSNR